VIDSPVERYRSLDPAKIAVTIERLCDRVEERFPGSGLGRVCRELHEIESLTTGLCRKFWQKVMILYSSPPSPEA
jgi:hypothetical protein